MNYKVYSLHNYRKLSALKKLSKEQLFDIEVVGNVLPFKTNNYVVNELIDWDNYETDPMFILNFPQKEMLKSHHYEQMATVLNTSSNKKRIRETADKIRIELNPHPAGQLELNVPELEGQKLPGIQHKYRETVLFFPSQGQTCHAYCTFCFRWPQFSGMDNFKFAMKEADLLVEYLKNHPSVTDILFTGGDPMIMSAKFLDAYISTLLKADLPQLKNIRIGTKSLAFWPYRYLTDKDADDVLRVFEKVVKSGRHLAIMAHFSHPVELSTAAVKKAIKRIRTTGAQIRTQSPVLNHINADSAIWSKMWKKQVALGLVPYYMFVARETGAQEYFSVPLVKTASIYREAFSSVSGICRTVRGPSMSANPGKVRIVGVSEVKGEKIIVLNFIQARRPEWVGRPFFAKYDENALWLNDLDPAFGEEEFFYTKEFDKILAVNKNKYSLNNKESEASLSMCS